METRERVRLQVPASSRHWSDSLANRSTNRVGGEATGESGAGHDALVAGLRLMYDRLKAEPVPQHLVTLAKRLDGGGSSR